MESLQHQYLIQTILESNKKTIINIYIVIGLYQSGNYFLINNMMSNLTTNDNNDILYIPYADTKTLLTESIFNIAYSDINATQEIYLLPQNIKYVIINFNDQSITKIKPIITELLNNIVIPYQYIFVFRNASNIVNIRINKIFNLLPTIMQYSYMQNYLNQSVERKKFNELRSIIQNKSIKINYKEVYDILLSINDNINKYFRGITIGDKNMIEYQKLFITNDIIQNYRENIIYYQYDKNTNIDISFDFSYYETQQNKNNYLSIILNNLGIQQTHLSNNKMPTIENYNKNLLHNTGINTLKYNNLTNIKAQKTEPKKSKTSFFEKAKYFKNFHFTTKYKGMAKSNNYIPKNK